MGLCVLDFLKPTHHSALIEPKTLGLVKIVLLELYKKTYLEHFKYLFKKVNSVSLDNRNVVLKSPSNLVR